MIRSNVNLSIFDEIESGSNPDASIIFYKITWYDLRSNDIYFGYSQYKTFSFLL